MHTECCNEVYSDIESVLTQPAIPVLRTWMGDNSWMQSLRVPLSFLFQHVHWVFGQNPPPVSESAAQAGGPVERHGMSSGVKADEVICKGAQQQPKTVEDEFLGAQGRCLLLSEHKAQLQERCMES